MPIYTLLALDSIREKQDKNQLTIEQGVQMLMAYSGIRNRAIVQMNHERYLRGIALAVLKDVGIPVRDMGLIELEETIAVYLGLKPARR